MPGAALWRSIIRGWTAIGNKVESQKWSHGKVTESRTLKHPCHCHSLLSGTQALAPSLTRSRRGCGKELGPDDEREASLINRRTLYHHSVLLPRRQLTHA